MYGELSTDPARGFTDMFARFPALMYLQERMRGTTSGKAAYNIYLGKHGVGSGIQPFESQHAVLPPPEKVFHFGLAPASWSNKMVVPMVTNGVLIKFIEILLKLLPPVTAVKNVTDMSSVIYVALTLDQKAVSPGAENFNDTIYGVQPPINAQEAKELCRDGFSAMLKTLINDFKTGERTWVKETEVFMIQLLDSLVAVPFAAYHVEKTGEWEEVRERVKEVLLYVNSCSRCLVHAVASGDPPNCKVMCKDCMKSRSVCGIHKDIYDSWKPDSRPCERCAEEIISKQQNIACCRFKTIISCSDMDPSYEKYGKSVSKDFTESLNSNDDSDVIHIHDIGHNIKNAEASLERGTHFDGETVYESSDIAVLMANLDGEHYQRLNSGISHRAVLQFDKQSDELSLQRISSQVIDSCKEVGQLIKTEVPEIRRPWFADSHESIGKPLFIAVSGRGVTFITDDYSQCLFFYRQSTLPRKLTYVGKGTKSTERDPIPQQYVGSDKLHWHSIAGVTFFKNDEYLLVADLGFKSIRVFQGSKMLRNQRKLLPISKLCSLPNMGLVVRTLNVQNKPSLNPCGISQVVSSNLLVVTDPVNKTVEILDMSTDCSTAMCISTINSNLFEHPFDCISVAADTIAITDLSKDNGKVHIIDANKNCIAYTLNELTVPAGLCMLGNRLMISDREQHCIYSFDIPTKNLALFLGTVGESGFEDGPVSKAKFSGPVGLCSRGLVLYIAENPRENQGAVRVASSLSGMIKFKSIWRNIAGLFGMISRRERFALLKKDQSFEQKICNVNEGLQKLHQPAEQLSELIAKIRDLTKRNRLDITDGSMASQTAEAVYITLLRALRYIKDYFAYIGQEELIEKIQLKCLTTRLVECFFGHITENVQGNNIRYLEMSRHLTNDAFTFLLPYVNSKETGVSVRSEKDRRGAETYSYSQDGFDIGHTALLWRFLSVKKQDLFTVEDFRNCRKANLGEGETRKSSFCIGTKNGVMDYMDVTSKDVIDNETRAALREIATALKSRPMRSLRGFSKRKFGTAPTILGTHGSRKDLESVNGTIHSIQSEGDLAADVILHDNEEFALELGEFIIFRGSDGCPFNILQLTKSYRRDELNPRKKIKGNFLTQDEVEENNSNVLYKVDPQWKGGSMSFSHVLRDEEDQIIAVELSLCLPSSNESPDTVRYRMEGEIYTAIQSLAEKFESSLQQDIDLPDGDVREDISDVNVTESFETEPQLTYTNRRERRGRGNRYAVVMNALLN